MLSLNNFRTSVLIYALLFLVLTFPFWGLDQTISPHRKFAELGIPDNSGSRLIENRKFSDFTNGYIPEIQDHLKGSNSGRLRVWTSQNELGRPLYQTGGYSRVYLPSWVITKITGNPLSFITILSLSYCFLTGLFVILFCREKGISPLAGLIAGGCIVTSPFFMYWLTFPIFLAVFCWTTGALWGCTRIAAKRDLIGWSALAFSIYSLLMTGYPQSVVFHSYIMAGYGLYLSWWVQRQRGWFEFGRFVASAASAVIVGAVLVLPVYIDLAHLTAESARVSPDSSFFTALLPRFDTLEEVVRFIVVGSTPELFGNPVKTNYPFPYDGISITPFVVFFALIGLLTSFRKTWGWWLSIAIIALITFVPPVYVFGIKYLGFNLSRGNPLGLITLPLTMIVAYGVDALVKRSASKELSWTIWVSAASVLVILAIGVGFGLAQAIPIRWRKLLIILAAIVLLIAQYRKTHPVLLVGALIVTAVTISYPLMLRQNPVQIATTSPLVEKVRANLPAGSRFAVAASGLPVLPPNLNAELGIASMHSYNSLSSRRYHALINALGGEVQTYGRSNVVISPDYSSAMFWMSNISLMLSPGKLSHDNLEDAGEESGVYMYKVISRMGDGLQVALPRIDGNSENIQLADPRLLAANTPVKLLDEDDVLEFEVIPGARSILILSQKFHRDWQAQVFDGSEWLPAAGTAVNGVFQGVMLPEEARRVRLEFKPYVRFAWIAHVFWVALLIVIGFKACQSKLRHMNNRK